LVAKGFSQVEGVDYEETFAPVIRFSALRMLFSIASSLNLEIDHLDVCAAFLNGSLDEEIYMELPESLKVDPNVRDPVCLLKRAIYGVKQSARMWNVKATEVLLGLGFRQSKFEPCIFMNSFKNSVIYVALFVDDFFIFYDNQREAMKLKEALKSNFKTKDLGAVEYCLGMEVVRDRSKGEIKLTQKRFCLETLERFGMKDAKPVNSPVNPSVKLEPAESCEYDVPYQRAIGSLMYLAVCTRPDIAFAVNHLSQFNNWCGTLVGS